MIKDITIGQYYPSDRLLHRLDPRVKLFGTLVFVVCLFLNKSIVVYGLSTAALIVLIIMSGVPVSYMIKGLKPILFLLIFTCGVNVFFGSGTDILYKAGPVTIYSESIWNALYLGIRLIELVLGSSIMTYTTTPTELADGLEKAFSPFEKLHVPVHDIALMMSITLRFIPILTDELNRIMKAQEARGVDFSDGKLTDKIKRTGALIIPLFSSALGRAGELALAMDARCYQAGRKRTKLRPLHYSLRDAVAYGVIVVYAAVSIII